MSQPVSTAVKIGTAAEAPDGGAVPRHVAIIMDGNGRWAKARGLPRTVGHREGAEALRRIVRASAEFGVDYLTVFGFSSENWKRPAEEVTDLMGLLRLYLRREIAEIDREGVRLRVIGDRDRLSADIIKLIEDAERRTAGNTRLNLTVALSYGGRAEIVRAAQQLAKAVEAGCLDPEDIDEGSFQRHLFTADIPDPDLVIRTSGEKRISNFLLWQSAYAEYVFMDKLWPDLAGEDLKLPSPSSAAGSGDMARPAERPSSNRAGLTNLQKRILSAAVLLPVAIAAIHFGHPYFTVLVAIFAGVMGWEWTSVVAHERASPETSPVPAPSAGWRGMAISAGAISVFVVLLTGFDAHIGAILGGTFAGVAMTGVAASRIDRAKAPWVALGVAYVAIPAAALVAIRSDQAFGLAALLWIIAMVVAADTGGYLVGRTVGGPKLAPRISPNKTWSGLGGAVAGAALAGLCTAFILNHTNVFMLTLISAVLGLLEQGGDLVESAFKRHFGVKDTSQIIPGHGGVLDRVDGLLAVAVAVLAINLWAGGSILAW